MSAEDLPRKVTDIRELLELSTPARVVTYETRGQRIDPADVPPEDERQTMEGMVRGEPTMLETRVKLVQYSEDARFVADLGIQYRFPEPISLEQELVADFFERVGMMAVYPFLRESIFTTASRLDVTRPILGLLHAGSIRLEQTPGEGGD